MKVLPSSRYEKVQNLQVLLRPVVVALETCRSILDTPQGGGERESLCTRVLVCNDSLLDSPLELANTPSYTSLVTSFPSISPYS